MPPKASSLAQMLDSDDSDMDGAGPRRAPTKGSSNAPKATAQKKPRKRKPMSKRLSSGRRNQRPTATSRAAEEDDSQLQESLIETTGDGSLLEQDQAHENGVTQPEDDDEEAVETASAPTKRRGRPPKGTQSKQDSQKPARGAAKGGAAKGKQRATKTKEVDRPGRGNANRARGRAKKPNYSDALEDEDEPEPGTEPESEPDPELEPEPEPEAEAEAEAESEAALEPYPEPVKQKSRGRPKRSKDVEVEAPEQEAMEAPAPKPRGRRKRVRDDALAMDKSHEETEATAEPDENVETGTPEADMVSSAPAHVDARRGPRTKRAPNASATKKRKRDFAPIEIEEFEEIEVPTREAGEEELQRKFDNVQTRYELLQKQYQKLQDVGIREAEANFDELHEKAQAQERAAEELIEALKADLAEAIEGNSEASKLQKRLEQSEKKARETQRTMEALQTRLGAAQGDNKTLQTKLGAIQSDNKTLQAKLAAAREASVVNGAAVAASSGAGRGTVPGSAAKGKAKADTSAAAAQAAIAGLKEDMYGDLTGLMIRSVEQGEEADVFDCIQTGRNGKSLLNLEQGEEVTDTHLALHFLLAIDKTDPGATYQETTIHYAPQLDPKRDADLLEILEDPLDDEIEFPRSHAMRFYMRIWETLTQRRH